MAIVTVFTPKSMTAAQYDEIIRQLIEAEMGAPKGRLYHTCFGVGDNLRVIDVWDTPENAQNFGGALMPILQQVGIVVEPEILPLYATVTGQ